MADAYLKEGDTAPSLFSTLQRPDDTPADINGATIALYVRRMRSGEVIIDGELADNLQLDEDTTGQVEYVFDAPLEHGAYEYEWQATYVSGEIETFPNDRWLTLAVVPEVGTGESS